MPITELPLTAVLVKETQKFMRPNVRSSTLEAVVKPPLPNS